MGQWLRNVKPIQIGPAKLEADLLWQVTHVNSAGATLQLNLFGLTTFTHISDRLWKEHTQWQRTRKPKSA